MEPELSNGSKRRVSLLRIVLVVLVLLDVLGLASVLPLLPVYDQSVGASARGWRG